MCFIKQNILHQNVNPPPAVRVAALLLNLLITPINALVEDAQRFGGRNFPDSTKCVGKPDVDRKPYSDSPLGTGSYQYWFGTVPVPVENLLMRAVHRDDF